MTKRRWLACGLGIVAAAGLAAKPARAAADAPLGFSVVVTLSTKAAARLAALKEGITVAAVFFGEATPAARKKADEMGQISLGEEKAALAASGGTAVFSGASIARAKFSWIKGRKPLVNVNVFSARRSDPNNILACDIYEGPIAAVALSPSRLHCKLIDEG